MSHLNSVRRRWVLTKSGSEMSERHGFDTHLNRQRVLTGSRDSMSTMSSRGRFSTFMISWLPFMVMTLPPVLSSTSPT